MSGDEKQTEATAGAPPTPQRTPITLRYAGASQVTSDGAGAVLALFGNAARKGVKGGGVIKGPLAVREALSALYEVVESDHRYKPKDKTAYLAYRRLKAQTSTLALWEAQRAYVDWLSRNDPLAFAVLDPIVSVHPDELSFEVFSKDEGGYAKLGVSWSAIEGDASARVHGTTNVDYSAALFAGVSRMRSYRATTIAVGSDAVSVGTAGAAEVIEKKVTIPDAWIRGLLQVQSAGALPRRVVKIAPIDLYNVLRYLRLHADRKKGGRGLRFELVPGERPRIVLEPWEEVIATTGSVYTGRAPEVVRVWGRRRLMLLRRLLPIATEVEVHLLGSGLPSFYVVRAGAITFTLGISGFTSANWAASAAFDLLLPRGSEAGERALAKVTEVLGKRFVGKASEVAAETKLASAEVLEALQMGCLRGVFTYDVAAEAYRFRPLTDEPLDASRYAYRNDRDRRAHDLIAHGAVAIEKENRIWGEGTELVGKVAVAAEKREYRPELLLDASDGRVRKAACTCAFFRKHDIKEGPCEHLIALRLFAAHEEQRRRGAAPDTVTVETRTYTRRRGKAEDVYQIALDERRLKLRFGPRGSAMRVQSLVFGSLDEARRDYMIRVSDLERRGYLDATSGS